MNRIKEFRIKSSWANSESIGKIGMETMYMVDSIRDKACCIIGQKNLQKRELENLKRHLENEVESAFLGGYKHFLLRLSDECDLIFAQIIDSLKDGNRKIILEAVLPYRSYIETKGRVYKDMLGRCDRVGAFSDIETPRCYEETNHFLIRNSDRVIVVCDEREIGGNLPALNFAQMLGKQIVKINLK